jgi:hypothetical protein
MIAPLMHRNSQTYHLSRTTQFYQQLLASELAISNEQVKKKQQEMESQGSFGYDALTPAIRTAVSVQFALSSNCIKAFS